MNFFLISTITPLCTFVVLFIERALFTVYMISSCRRFKLLGQIVIIISARIYKPFHSPDQRDSGIVAATEAVGADADEDGDGDENAGAGARVGACACGAAGDGKSFDLAAVAPFSPTTPPRSVADFVAKECGKLLLIQVTGYMRGDRKLISPTFFSHLLRIWIVPLYRVG